MCDTVFFGNKNCGTIRGHLTCFCVTFTVPITHRRDVPQVVFVKQPSKEGTRCLCFHRLNVKALQHQYPKVTFKCPLHDSPFGSLYIVYFSIKKSTTEEKDVNDKFCPNNDGQGVKLLANSLCVYGNNFLCGG